LSRTGRIKPGEKAVVVTADEVGREAARYSARRVSEIAAVYDLRRERLREIVGRGRGGILRSVEIDGRKLSCDLLVMSGGRQPAYSLLAQAGRAGRVRPERGVSSRPTSRTGSRPSGRSPARASTARYRLRPTTAPRQGQVLRLRLRGRDGQGPEARDRRGLRLHRARQALHHCDDGPLPGPPVPRALDPPLRAREREGRGDDRDDDCAPALGARSRSASSRAGRTSRRSARPSTIATRSSARR
jgi:hypothetical protein